MRKALSLIELILTIVIIAIVFTVIPKIIFATNQSFIVGAKQDGIFNAVQLMQVIARKPWDNRSIQTMNILDVDNGDANLDCNTTTGYRPGGFIGGRNCLENNNTIRATRTSDPEWSDGAQLLDVDDYNAFNTTATGTKCVQYNTYGLAPSVGYRRLNISYPTATSADINLTAMGTPGGVNSSNIKEVNLSVGFAGTNAQRFGAAGCIRFNYYSANIGQFYVNKRYYD